MLLTPLPSGCQVLYKESERLQLGKPQWSVIEILEDLDGQNYAEVYHARVFRFEKVELLNNDGKFKGHGYSAAAWSDKAWADGWWMPTDSDIPVELLRHIEDLICQSSIQEKEFTDAPDLDEDEKLAAVIPD